MVKEFRRSDLSYDPPFLRSTMLLANYTLQNVDPDVAGHHQIHQLLLFAPADARWSQPVTEDMVRRTCEARRIKDYEDLIGPMTLWLNSAQAAWLFLYLWELLTLTCAAPSAWLADSGCRIYNPR